MWQKIPEQLPAVAAIRTSLLSEEAILVAQPRRAFGCLQHRCPLTVTPGETSSQNHSAEPRQIHRTMRDDSQQFKPLGFKVVCCTVVDNWEISRNLPGDHSTSFFFFF